MRTVAIQRLVKQMTRRKVGQQKYLPEPAKEKLVKMAIKNINASKDPSKESGRWMTVLEKARVEMPRGKAYWDIYQIRTTETLRSSIETKHRVDAKRLPALKIIREDPTW